jgi:hypothetical protein
MTPQWAMFPPDPFMSYAERLFWGRGAGRTGLGSELERGTGRGHTVAQGGHVKRVIWGVNKATEAEETRIHGPEGSTGKGRERTERGLSRALLDAPWDPWALPTPGATNQEPSWGFTGRSPRQPRAAVLLGNGHQNPNSQAGWPQSVCSMEFSRTWLQGDTSVTHGTLHHNPFCGTGV